MADDLELLALSAVAQLQPPVTATPIATLSTGTGSSGTTETFDAVLGYYQTTLIAGRRYLAIVNGLLLSGSVAADSYTVRIRYSASSSNPTSASPAVGSSQYYVPTAGGPGQQVVALGGSFIASATGLSTFGLSVTRSAGTGVGTPVGNRELYVMYLGAV
jgi:hypothetical protein